MIYIVTALMLEASPIIDHYKLKRDMSVHPYPVFANKDISLIVSGIGKVKSAIAITFLRSTYSSTANHIIINVGFCGARIRKYPLGSLLLINKVTDLDTGKDYYPDVYAGYDLPKEPLACCSKPVTHDNSSYEDNFFDMESAGIMEASYKFFNTHQVAILKIVSDFLTPENLDKQVLRGYINNNIPILDRIINELKQLTLMVSSPNFEEEEKLISVISQNVRLSSAMKGILQTEVKKAKTKGLTAIEVLKKYLDNKANTKLEGKKIFVQIIEDIRQKTF
ncbi:nucleoside phosphorylase [Pseudobacteroides cellulosolvens]|uniref:Purine or other phosphorylase family 1 n=1 Tax=Pseudobacteroides cellulosolvens ATCC 35603 = DSM 2933 TaxID=398512 RepID=A0A0L6JVT4_9FIRM|nr:nucleoside phosphorylase [Pseudobacteroides cellulosolvens]KNY29948.1 purine or other phosphorylase family 1 [Pseudobacteroides cellulosolvens ATCC 35603 = DSM 2933]